MMFVLDCSVAVAWLFEDETSRETDALLDALRLDAALVPALWHLEVGNVLTMAERRGRITPSQVAASLELLAALPIRTESLQPRLIPGIVALARNERLTAYDAAYLDLALRHGLPLATLDEALRKAAHRLQVPLLP